MFGSEHMLLSSCSQLSLTGRHNPGNQQPFSAVRPGLAFFYAGMVRHKNLVATIMQACVTLAIIPFLWCILG
jgi:hypothetical protein